MTRHIFPLVVGRFPKRPVAATRTRRWCLPFIFSTVLALGNIVDFVKKFCR